MQSIIDNSVIHIGNTLIHTYNNRQRVSKYFKNIFSWVPNRIFNSSPQYIVCVLQLTVRLFFFAKYFYHGIS